MHRLTDATGNRTRFGIAAKLIIPFVITCFGLTLMLAASFCWKMSAGLTDCLDEKCRILTSNCASQLMEPLILGQSPRMDEILQSVLKSDHDLRYLAFESPDGSVYAIADPGHLTRSIKPKTRSFSRLINNTVKRETSNPHIFEIVEHVNASDVDVGTLRMGFSNERVESSIRSAELMIVVIGCVSLVLGISTYIVLIGHAIIKPISKLAKISATVARGDLSQSVPVARNDEIGDLLIASNDMIGYLHEMAGTADAIASGNLNVEVGARSPGDVFGNAFRKMVKCLREQTRQLAAREQRFRSLCQASPVGIFETDTQGMITYANACWQQITGVALDQLAAVPWYQGIHPDDQPLVTAQWKQMLMDGPSGKYEAEVRFVRPTGELCWGKALAIPLKVDDAEITGYVGTVENVTRRKVSDMAHFGIPAVLTEAKSVEEAAAKMLELACHTLDLAAAVWWQCDEKDGCLRPKCIWPTDSEMQVVEEQSFYANRLSFVVAETGRAMWMSREQLLNYSNTSDLFLKAQNINSAFACPVKANNRVNGVLKFYSHASNQLDDSLMESYASVALQLGQFTERLEAQSNAQQLAAIVQHSQDAIISASLSGTIISWNKGAENLFGYAAAEVKGKSVEMLLLNQSHDQFSSLVAGLIDDKSVEDFETVNVRNDGSKVDVSLTISPVRSESGGVTAMSIIARDITHKKVIEQRMREFYSVISHELRTPLTSIRGSLGLLADGVVPLDSPEGAEMIALAKSSSLRLLRLINDILDLRKIEAGSLELDLQSIDSTEVVERSIEAMLGLAYTRGVKLTPKYERQGMLVADLDRITQVMTNLISNAIKYSERGGEVLISVLPAEHSGKMRFAVKDSGAGIAKEHQSKLFGKFQQIDSSDSRAKEGTGLGLAISKAIVEQHGGIIGVDSTPGAGSTFWFELRLTAENARQVRPAADDPQAVSYGAVNQGTSKI